MVFIEIIGLVVNPACAGMIPAPDGRPLYQRCKPRVCGDDPPAQVLADLTGE